MNKINFRGFTLAEVLITLGIIGVVAAMTIPSLVKNQQEYSMKQAWKKQYSTLSQAYEKWKFDEGGDVTSYFEIGVTISPLKYMKNYLSIFKSCDSGYTNVCGSLTIDLHDNFYKTLSGSYMNYNDLIYYQMILKDGTNVFSRKSTGSANAIIWVDVNGFAKGPNTLGKDMYGVVVNKDKMIPIGAEGSGVTNPCSKNDICPGSTGGFHSSSCAGAGCSAEYLYK